MILGWAALGWAALGLLLSDSHRLHIVLSIFNSQQINISAPRYLYFEQHEQHGQEVKLFLLPVHQRTHVRMDSTWGTLACCPQVGT